MHQDITLFRFITLFRGTINILHNIPHIQIECGKYFRIFCRILSVPQNIVMNLINVMENAKLNCPISFVETTSPPKVAPLKRSHCFKDSSNIHENVRVTHTIDGRVGNV